MSERLPEANTRTRIATASIVELGDPTVALGPLTVEGEGGQDRDRDTRPYYREKTTLPAYTPSIVVLMRLRPTQLED